MDSIFESDGLKIIGLSHRKIMVVYKIPILHDGFTEPFDWINVKIRYVWNHTDQIFHIIFPKVGFYSKLSNSLRVKMKNIRTDFLGGNIFSGTEGGIKTVDAENPLQPGSPIRLMRFIVSLTITDQVWSRDHKLNLVLDGKVQ